MTLTRGDYVTILVVAALFFLFATQLFGASVGTGLLFALSSVPVLLLRVYLARNTWR